MSQLLDAERPKIDLAELAEANDFLEHQPASTAVKWAWDRFGTGIVLAASFQDCVLIDIAITEVPDLPVVFLDTQYHFPETLAYVETIRERYALDLAVMAPLVEPDEMWRTDTDECCAMRKVEPLARALAGREAWMTGLRRSDTPTRANAPIVGVDVGRGLVKVNPLATWTDLDVEGYKQDRDLPEHPLVASGYASIGCAPCTRPVDAGDDPRSGRWAATGKTECGLHGWS